jgi:hypothetical protein
LLLSVALLLMVSPWLEQPNYAALRLYLAYPLSLASEVDRLDDDPLWQKFKAAHESADSMSIQELLEASVVVSESKAPDTPKSKRTPNLRHPPISGGVASRSIPAAPTGLSVSVSEHLQQMQTIAEMLKGLNDSDILTHSRRVSNFFEFSIVRWVQKRNGLANRNQIETSCFAQYLGAPTQGYKPSDFIPALQNDGMLKCLTLRDVTELAHTELPAFTIPPQLGERVGGQIDVTPGSLPHDLYAASVLAQLLLFFVMTYFCAFASEAASSPGFPAPGTLFSAFSRSRSTLFIFSFATFVPLLASTLVCWSSWASISVLRRLSLVGCMTFVALASFSMQLVFWEKSYFRGVYLPLQTFIWGALTSKMKTLLNVGDRSVILDRLDALSHS